MMREFYKYMNEKCSGATREVDFSNDWERKFYY